MTWRVRISAMARRWNDSCRPTSSKAAPADATLRPICRPALPMAAISPLPRSSELLGDEGEVQRRHDEVGEEDQDERDDDGLVHGVAHALRAALGVEALVAGDHGGDET